MFMARRFSFLFFIVSLLALCLQGRAVAAELGGFFDGLKSFEADFEQTVIAQQGDGVQSSSGRVWIQRPNRFRWHYAEPYVQEIVADGRNLWTFDADLEQATVKSMDEVLSATPAMLLSGEEPLESLFRVTALGERDGLEWFVLVPREPDGGVEEIQLGLRDGMLEAMDVLDPLGNSTRIRFRDLRRNGDIDPGRFRFQPPNGSDLIGTPSPAP